VLGDLGKRSKKEWLRNPGRRLENNGRRRGRRGRMAKPLSAQIDCVYHDPSFLLA
jgi:hypothetical protein